MKKLMMMLALVSACTQQPSTPVAKKESNDLIMEMAPETIDLSMFGETLSGSISNAASSIDFGNVYVGAKANKRIKIVAQTAIPSLDLSDFESSQVFVLKKSTCKQALSAKRSCVLDIEYSPSQIGAVSEIISINSSLNFELEANAIAAPTVQPPSASEKATTLNISSSVDLGNFTGLRRMGRVTVTNLGKAPAEITIDETSMPAGFSYTSHCPVAPEMLAAKRACQVEVSYLSSDKENSDVQRSASLVINTKSAQVSVVHKGNTLSENANFSWSTNPLNLGTISSPRKQMLFILNKTSEELSGLSFNALPAGVTVSRTSCGSVLKSKRQCFVEFNFNPNQMVTGSFNFTHSYANNLITANLPITALVIGGIAGAQCSEGEHAENGSCVPNIQSCSVSNGVGQKTWNNGSYGACFVQSCNQNYSIVNNNCVPTACSISDVEFSLAVTGNKVSGCEALRCKGDLEIQNGICQATIKSTINLQRNFISNNSTMQGESTVNTSFGTDGLESTLSTYLTANSSASYYFNNLNLSSIPGKEPGVANTLSLFFNERPQPNVNVNISAGNGNVSTQTSGSIYEDAIPSGDGRWVARYEVYDLLTPYINFSFSNRDTSSNKTVKLAGYRIDGPGFGCSASPKITNKQASASPVNDGEIIAFNFTKAQSNYYANQLTSQDFYSIKLNDVVKFSSGAKGKITGLYYSNNDQNLEIHVTNPTSQTPSGMKIITIESPTSVYCSGKITSETIAFNFSNILITGSINNNYFDPTNPPTGIYKTSGVEGYNASVRYLNSQINTGFGSVEFYIDGTMSYSNPLRDGFVAGLGSGSYDTTGGLNSIKYGISVDANRSVVVVNNGVVVERNGSPISGGSMNDGVPTKFKIEVHGSYVVYYKDDIPFYFHRDYLSTDPIPYPLYFEASFKKSLATIRDVTISYENETTMQPETPGDEHIFDFFFSNQLTFIKNLYFSPNVSYQDYSGFNVDTSMDGYAYLYLELPFIPADQDGNGPKYRIRVYYDASSRYNVGLNLSFAGSYLYGTDNWGYEEFISDGATYPGAYSLNLDILGSGYISISRIEIVPY